VYAEFFLGVGMLRLLKIVFSSDGNRVCAVESMTLYSAIERFRISVLDILSVFQGIVRSKK